MIIDCHVHVKHGNRDATEYTAAQIIGVMDDAGIDKSVVFAIKTGTRRSIEMAREAVQEYPDRLVAFAYALPNAEGSILPDLEDAVTNQGFKGIKMHKGEVTLAQYVTDPILDLAGRLAIPCLIDFMNSYSDLDRMAASFPGTNIIVAHMGRYKTTDEELIDRYIALATRYDNVYLDISGVVLIWKIKDAIERVGASRVVFGTDGPQPTLEKAGFYARSEVTRIKTAGFSPEDTEAVLGGTIARLLGLA